MDVKLDNFVTINLVKHEYSTSSAGTRNVAVLINFLEIVEGQTKTSGKVRIGSGYFEQNKYFEKADYDTLVENLGTDATDEEKQLLSYFTNFFSNNQKGKLRLIHQNKQSSVPETVKMIKMEEIVILACGLAEGHENDLVQHLTGTGIDQKIFVGRIATGTTLSTYTMPTAEFYIKKMGDAGIEATVAAYLTSIKLAEFDTAKDYCFTKETVKSGDVFENEVIEYITDEDDPMHFNADCKLVNVIRNIGGNDCSGYSLINQFMLICLYQTLTERLVNVLTSKVKYDSIGIGKIMTAIDLEMKKYINNGYVSLNKIYTDDDLIWNNQLIISKDELLKSGYKVFMAPYSAEDMINHRLPGIYLLLADQYAIRKIKITGEVI